MGAASAAARLHRDVKPGKSSSALRRSLFDQNARGPYAWRVVRLRDELVGISNGKAPWLGLALSLAAHWWLARVIPAHVAPTHETFVPLEVAAAEPEEGLGQEAPGTHPLGRERALPGGQTNAANVDSDTSGRGGAATGETAYVLLVNGVAPLTLVDAPTNAADRSQVQRIDTGRDRASWENRRATPHPDDDAFLASGEGTHRERRPEASTDAQSGARVAGAESALGSSNSGQGEVASTSGASGSAQAQPSPSRSASPGGRPSALGAQQASPGVGILGGEGRRSTTAANVASGRPSLDLGPAATSANERARVQDNTDAELLAASLFESRVDASRRASQAQGSGVGGATGTEGAGTSASGSGQGRAAPFGPGSGAYDALDTGDARYRTWLLAQRRRIESALVFPRARQLARDQGTSVVRVTVRLDGSISGRPRIARSSGYEDLDEAALQAVIASLPFAAIPPDLARGRTQLEVTLPVAFSNPMVQ